MKKLEVYIRLTIVLAFTAIFAMVLSHLALTDIHHGGEDLSLEWTVLRIAALVFLTFAVLTIITITKVLKSFREGKEK